VQIAVEKDWILETFDDDFLSLVEGEVLEHDGVSWPTDTDAPTGALVAPAVAGCPPVNRYETHVQYWVP